MSDPNGKADYSVDELRLVVGQEIAEIQAEEVTYEERLAIQAFDDGLTTDRRATIALMGPERFPGEHDVARAWLKNSRTALHFAETSGERHGGVHL